MIDGLLHLDSHVLVMNKPSGLAVHPGWVPRTERTALHWARKHAKQHVFPVHRLDRGTSGALVFALDPATARTLNEAFTAGEIRKSYLALVRGQPADSGTIDHPIPRKEGGPRVASVTDYQRLARSPNDRCSLVLARPRTGRLHQIRRHLKHLSHPLVGDVRYGKGDINRRYRERWNLHRLALHALELGFAHPATGEPMNFRASLPPDLAEPLTALELTASIPDERTQGT